MHGNTHILNVHALFVLPLVTPGIMPVVPSVRTAVQSLILASLPPSRLNRFVFLCLAATCHILRIKQVSFSMAGQVRNMSWMCSILNSTFYTCVCGWECYLWCGKRFAVCAVSRHTHAAIPTRNGPKFL